MEFEYKNNIENIEPKQLDGFFVGWSKCPSSERHLDILKSSYAVWIALEKDKCVGFINAISDGIFYAHIPLLEVLPEYQNRGVGTELVKLMSSTLSNMYAVDVLCDHDKVKFYTSRGFKECSGAALRNYHNQKIE